MRADYKYVDEATSLDLVTTDKGSKYTEGLSTEELEALPGGLKELLLLAENCYIMVKSKADIDEWLEAVYETASSEYCADPGITKEDLAKAFTLGYIAFRKIIWDEPLELS